MRSDRPTSWFTSTGLLTAALCAVAASLASVLSFPAPASAASLVPASVDVNAPVSSGTQCAPCHARIAEAIKPGIIFTHGSHLLVSCDGCHWGPPHRGGSSLGPPMESCFNCHGIPHGAKPVARSDCPACHTPSFRLRPAWHTPDWKAKPHAERAKLGENVCLMCHKAVEFCDACHKDAGLDVAPTQPVYRPMIRREPLRPSLQIYPDGQTSMSQCGNCHPDLDRFLPGRVIFAHGQHLQAAFRCESCHKRFGHGPDETYRPEMSTCYACHGLTHASATPIATQECSACHPPDFALKPKDHTADFVAKAHREAANLEPEMCAMCHDSSFCTACHQGRPAKPGGKPRPKVIPADHRKKDFRLVHGGEFLKRNGACASCHDATTCVRCHKTPVPHPADWGSSHSQVKGLDAKDCNVCHVDRARCQQCHHDKLRGATLVLDNCVKCHPVMRTDPPTAIKNKGLAEHAVHFKVGRDSKFRATPYKCYDCHVGFTATVASRMATLQKGHDLRLCYDCHGALDYTGKLIAPYPGSALCLRCHKDLDL